jgi:hypothetical protein
MKQILFAILFSLCTPAAMAQLVGEIKIVAVQEFSDLAPQANGYYGGGDADLDFRKGVGGGYVFAVFKDTNDPSQYITEVKVTTRSAYGIEFTENGKLYTPAPFYQESKDHYDGSYRGGLNGRNYSIYGGSYDGQAHVYVTRTGNWDFDRSVLKSVRVVTSRPSGGHYSGPHAGGGRYFVYTWHTHEPKFKATGDINYHVRYCGRDNCKLTKTEPHNFPPQYGHDTWSQRTKSDPQCDKSHFKKCLDCGQVVSEDHKWASYVSDSQDHNKKCLVCDYVMQSDHQNFGKQKLPVDENYHMIYCEDCGFLQKLRHDFGDVRVERSRDCEHILAEYTCTQCSHHAYFEEPGLGHDFDANGICRRQDCLHPYESPATEPFGTEGDSAYVIKNYGNLYWVADYINRRHPNINVRLDNDLQAEDFISLPWQPIGYNDETAFQGTFDGGGHVIAMLQTEEPEAGCGYRGLFGAIGKEGIVKDLTLASCHMRGWDDIGSVAGVNDGTIDKCHVIFSIVSTIGTGMNLGGICGLNRGTISGCTTARDVWVGSVRDYAGGICGTNGGGSLLNNTTAAICGSGTDARLPETASQQ